ncbi:ABC transporter substrate-binding protein [Thalassotalea marina]|uniref:NitT/TauT family transport system substrate-binding protein n=1 Tax=Thalassotalea marina TaxID=1673741 RepID=A0A919BK36_9GAMM|nr:ABC transporter substrate-binding protein [Thalassotalea marina]GHF97037.1 hypothetical protein GCM10017161_26430 [Thalassotalea marina]
MMKVWKTLLLISALLLMSCSDKTRPLKIGTNNWIGYESLYVIDKLNMLDEPLTLIRQSNATDVMSLFEQGKIDVACLTLDEAMILIEKGVELHFVSVMDVSNGADQVLASEQVESITQLKDKRIGVETTALGRLVLSSLLDHANLTLEDVEIVNSTVDKHFEMVQKNEIDAAVTFPPFSDHMLNQGMHKLFDSSQMDDAPIIDVMVVNRYAKDSRKETLSQLINSLYKVNNRLLNKDPEVLKIVGTNLNLPPAEWPEMTTGVQLANKELNNTYINRYKLEATMLILDEVMLNNGLLNQSITEKVDTSMFVRL